MYRGFKLEGFEDFVRPDGIDRDAERGELLASVHRSLITENLERYVDSDGFLSGAEISNQWFPQVQCEVFISHSHDDKDLALRIAGRLHNTLGIRAFVDSTVWGFAAELLRKIDDKYCYNQDTGTYCYRSRNYTTSHVHMILGTALTKMIDNTECLFFLNTPSSLNVKNMVEQTKSAWIYHELAVAGMIRQKLPSAHRNDPVMIERYEAMGKSAQLSAQFSHDLDTRHLQKMTYWDLQLWELAYRANNSTTHPLDHLYKLPL